MPKYSSRMMTLLTFKMKLMHRILVNPEFAYKLSCYIFFIAVNFFKDVFLCVSEVIILKARSFFFHKAKCFHQQGVPFWYCSILTVIFSFKIKEKQSIYRYVCMHLLKYSYTHINACRLPQCVL